MKIALSILVTIALSVGTASALQLFGHPCSEEKACDSSVGLLCSESLKTCDCQSLNGTRESEKINLVWSKGECAVKVQDTCLITNSSASPPHNETVAPTPTEGSTSTLAPAASAPQFRCIQDAECINGTCQCMQGHQPGKDLTTCAKSGAFSITGVPLFIGLISMFFSIIFL